MGIDARILVRNVPRAIVTDEWCKEKSWQLCQAIGASKFFISDGLPPAQYTVADKAWHAGFNAHPLYAEFAAIHDGNRNRGFMVAQPEQERARLEEIHRLIRVDIGEAPQERRLAIEPTYSYSDEDHEVLGLPGSRYHQDGPTIEATTDECLLRVSLWTRYYGIDYERGDILTICAVAEWLEVNLAGCEVWYGGDSSGICAEPFTDSKRRDLRRHLYGTKGRDYFAAISDHEPFAKPPACGLCPGNRYRGRRYGFGRNNTWASFSCAGCGSNVESSDAGQTWTKKKDDEL